MRHKQNTLRITAGIAAGLVAGMAAFPAIAQDDYAVVEERMRELAPSAESIAVSETPVNGILQVQIQGEIYYTSTDGRYLFQGRLIDLDTRDDLTEKAKAVQRKDLMAGIDSSKQITFEPEDPEYELVVFTDIDCGYCRKLHSQMAEYNEQGIGIRYMSFPRAGIGSNSYNKYVSVWCADDQKAALTDAKAGADPEPLQCDNPVAEQYQLGVAMGVTGTPALLMNDGQLIPGYVPPDKLKERLDQMSGVETATD
ncbi:MAG: DsbC family protein [Xanthomonadales bacterium]|nr:DsbC family protein [Xanthomonadales bacterium]